MLDAGSMQFPTAFIVGASRGLGRAIANELMTRQWRVIGSVRAPTSRARWNFGRSREVQRLDVTDVEQIAFCAKGCRASSMDMLFASMPEPQQGC